MRPRPRGASTAGGIDALLGDETRPHGDDLDLAVVRADLPRLEACQASASRRGPRTGADRATSTAHGGPRAADYDDARPNT